VASASLPGTFSIQVAAASRAGVTTKNTKLSPSHGRNGPVYGQNRRKISRIRPPVPTPPGRHRRPARMNAPRPGTGQAQASDPPGRGRREWLPTCGRRASPYRAYWVASVLTGGSGPSPSPSRGGAVAVLPTISPPAVVVVLLLLILSVLVVPARVPHRNPSK
jgi:hypothetical protein